MRGEPLLRLHTLVVTLVSFAGREPKLLPLGEIGLLSQ